jgi:hypothetical protein
VRRDLLAVAGQLVDWLTGCLAEGLEGGRAVGV